MKKEYLEIFEEKHIIGILMYVAGNPGCKKTDIYEAVSRNPRMPEKIEALENVGLMTHETINRSTFYKLTTGGNNVAELFSVVSNELSNLDRSARGHPTAGVAARPSPGSGFDSGMMLPPVLVREPKRIDPSDSRTVT